MIKNLLPLTILTISMTGCASAPIYQPTDINKTVSIASDNDAALRICKDDEWYRLEKDSNGLVHVPYGKRISIKNRYSHSDGNEIDSCSPYLSFIPIAGNKYYLNFLIVGETCKVEVLRYSSNSKTGLAPVDTSSDELACLPK